MRVVGHDPAHPCASWLLVGSMLVSFAGLSMAVVDDVADSEPPPPRAACPELHRAR